MQVTMTDQTAMQTLHVNGLPILRICANTLNGPFILVNRTLVKIPIPANNVKLTVTM